MDIRPDGREPRRVPKADFREVSGGDTADRFVVEHHARGGDVRSAEREVHERDAAPRETFHKAWRLVAFPQGDERAIAIPVVGRTQKPIGEDEPPTMFAGIPDDAVEHLGERRRNHQHDLALFHGGNYSMTAV